MLSKIIKKIQNHLLGTDVCEIRENQDIIKKQIIKIQKHLLGTNIREILENQEVIKKQLDEIQRITTEGRLISGWIDGKLRNFESNWQLETMSKYGDVSNYKVCKHIARLHELLQIKSVEGDACLFRTGNSADGGYIMLDKFIENQVAYSFGICDDVSWDKFMAERGFDVYMYDHTIAGLPEENEKFHWQKIGLAGIYDEKHPELHTLPMLLEENGHTDKKHMILKIDIEGAEWDVLANLPDKYMEQFDQIVLEMHDLHNLNNLNKMEKSLEKLNKYHQLVHIHGNNCNWYLMAQGKVLPYVIECSFIKKDLCEFGDSKREYPRELDNNNNDGWPDIFLGSWN